MLVPFQTSGAKPPLYLVHGLYGLMPVGDFFARSLGSDQPLYGINANGIDGREATACDAQAMALAYVEEIVDVQPSGPLLIGGMCAGGFIAMEMVRELQARGREVGPLILLDPPPVPHGYKGGSWLIDPRNPEIVSQLYRRAKNKLLDHDLRLLPFAVDDQQRVHLATLASVNVLVALNHHRPKAFPGKATAIVSSERAAGFFHHQMPWAKLLSQRPISYVLSCSHHEFFQSARHDLVRILKFVLEDVRCENQTEGAAGSIFASA